MDNEQGVFVFMTREDYTLLMNNLTELCNYLHQKQDWKPHMLAELIQSRIKSLEVPHE